MHILNGPSYFKLVRLSIYLPSPSFSLSTPADQANPLEKLRRPIPPACIQNGNIYRREIRGLTSFLGVVILQRTLGLRMQLSLPH